ncbi:MAG: hypothetical protein JRI23_24065 [Deltaproteobacteria bacterium]|jgi:nitrogenase molybdenum-iron protein alpha/beta subunit|nr:hypothetical protein [Deltaproteobacteria bacterium]MBW2535068.1 hypothetical protein [Deltaproteobacteria bacterium]
MTDQLGLPFNQPYLIGVLLAVGAIADAHLVVDGPGCLLAKAQLIHGPHDLGCTLLDCAGPHRVDFTGVDVDRLASDIEAQVLGRLQHGARQQQVGVVLLSALPMCEILGTDYERLAQQARSQMAEPVLVVPGRSLSEDWLAGYGAVLRALASGLELSPPAPRPDAVAVVGYFMDRNEGDHRGNVAAIATMLQALDLDLVSLWLSGSTVEQLRSVRHAETILSLPHGREAAATLARRLDARLVEVGLPFGLEGTRAWITDVAEATGRQQQLQAYLRRELDLAAGRLQWFIPQIFLERRFAFAGDPHYARPLAGLIEELGGQLATMVLVGDEGHLSSDDRAALEQICPVFFQPRISRGQLPAELGLDAEAIDLAIATTDAKEVLHLPSPWVEWGYPSRFTHWPADEPFLGFDGCLRFVGRLSNALLHEASRR